MILRKKITIFLLSCFLIVLAACGADNNSAETDINSNDESMNENNEANENNSEDEYNEDSASNNENDSNGSNNDAANSEEDDLADVERITETGIYNGQADPHTIEVETEDGPTAFQLTMEARDDID